MRYFKFIILLVIRQNTHFISLTGLSSLWFLGDRNKDSFISFYPFFLYFLSGSFVTFANEIIFWTSNIISDIKLNSWSTHTRTHTHTFQLLKILQAFVSAELSLDWILIYLLELQYPWSLPYLFNFVQWCHCFGSCKWFYQLHAAFTYFKVYVQISTISFLQRRRQG